MGRGGVPLLRSRWGGGVPLPRFRQRGYPILGPGRGHPPGVSPSPAGGAHLGYPSPAGGCLPRVPPSRRVPTQGTPQQGGVLPGVPPPGRSQHNVYFLCGSRYAQHILMVFGYSDYYYSMMISVWRTFSDFI